MDSSQHSGFVVSPGDASFRCRTKASLLHKPSVTLRKAGEVSDHDLIDAARRLFGLDKD